MHARALALATLVAALALPAGAAAAKQKDCAGKPAAVPKEARTLLPVLKQPRGHMSAKRRRGVCREGIDPFGLVPGEARRIDSPKDPTKGAWFLVPGRTGFVLDTNGGGQGTTYDQLREHGWAGAYIGNRIVLGVVAGDHTTITASGNYDDGRPGAVFTAPVQDNVFYLPTPGASSSALTITLG
jgi:hypothetical protein